MLKSIWETIYLAIIPMIFGVGVFYLIPDFTWNNQLFHTCLESGGSIIAFTLALLVNGMIKKQRLGINYIWLIACFTSMGILDLAHSQVIPGQAFVWLHSTATLVGGFFAALIWCPKTFSKKFAHKGFLISLILISIIFSIWSILYPEMTYSMLNEHKKFTLEAEIINFTGGFLFLISWSYFALQYHYQKHPEFFYFSNHFCLFGLAAILFEVSILWDANWWLWHCLRAFAYLLVSIHFSKMYWDDITTLAFLNHKLNKQKEHFEILFQKSSYGMAILEHGKITECNEQAFKMLGYANKTEFMQHPGVLSSPYQADGQDSKLKADKMIALCFQNGSHQFEWLHRKKDGTDFWVNVLLTKLDYPNKVLIHAVLRDISQEKEVQCLKEEFLANISHELRTPINGVLGITELLANTNLDAAQKNYVTTIQISGETLLLLLNDILDNAKMNAGEIFFQENEFNPNDIVTHIALLLSKAATNKNLSVVTEISEPAPAYYAIGDPDRIRQIVMNLANNAIKFTEQGEIKLKVFLTQHDSKMDCTFEVHDTGIGIELVDQEHLFDPFVQVDSTDTRKHMGTGLGLSICKKLVIAMGGNISFSSQINLGSKFWFTLILPVGRKISKVDKHKLQTMVVNDKITEELKKSAKILVVEDHAINQMVITGILEQYGFEFECVNNGQEAIEAYKISQYSLIFMDIQMPIMDGYDATRAIRSMELANNSSKIPIVALTANTTKNVSKKIYAAGMSDYLTKPIVADRIYQTIKKWLVIPIS